MSNSRAESSNASNTPRYGRKRSDTLQSMLRSPTSATPLVVGNTKHLTLWVNDAATSSSSPNVHDVVLNPECWPGVLDGDMIRVTAVPDDADALTDLDLDGRWERDGFLFIFNAKDAQGSSPGLQISVTKSIASAFDLRHYMLVRLTKVDRNRMCTDYMEIVFQDQYLGRSDMWRLGKQLQGQCIHIGQEVSFVGSPTGKISSIYIDGKNVSAGLVTAKTKAIFRSLSAKVTIFIQVCRELWEFAGDGERYNEKVVHSFLPALFRKWREAGTNHIVTIVLISRVFYEEGEIEYAAGPLRREEDNKDDDGETHGRWYKDFFKVITDLEAVEDWKPTLVSLKDAFVAFQRDILLTHHYHRSTSNSNPSMGLPGSMDDVRLVGRISFAHEGPVLEALNLALNPLSTHYIDRSLSLTGVGAILVTPGTGHYRVSKRLLRLTTTRLLDQGFGLDVVSLAKPPLHQTPVFSFKGSEPNQDADNSRSGSRNNDPLWGGDANNSLDDSQSTKKKSTFWWEPLWVTISFWDRQMDLPFRQDRFVARAKMHQIEMLGLLEHDVLSSINVPYLPECLDPIRTPSDDQQLDFHKDWRAEAEKFDLERFALRKHPPPIHLASGRESGGSSGVTTVMDPSSYRSHMLEKRPTYVLHRSSTGLPRIAPIEESPRRIYTDLPPEDGEKELGTFLPSSSTTLISSSPRSSLLSSKEEEETKVDSSQPDDEGVGRTTFGSKFGASWLFNPFRSGARTPKQRQVTPEESSGSSSSSATRITTPPPGRVPPATTSVSAMSISQGRTPRQPMAIRATPTRGSTLRQMIDDENTLAARTVHRHSPNNMTGISPRDDPFFMHRRATITSVTSNGPVASASPVTRTNPLRPSTTVPYSQSSMASRWQHMFPQPLYRHEIKWKSMVNPGSLPLTTEFFPSKSELEASYEMFSYDFVVDPPEMRSFLVKPPTLNGRENSDQVRQAWALVVMRGMAALRLIQGFQFVVRTNQKTTSEKGPSEEREKYFAVDDDRTPKPFGASEIFQTDTEPVFLSMSNEIHRLSYNGESIHVRRYVRRMPPSKPFEYQCLVWPKLGVGYTELKTTFVIHGLENYGWNRLDMLVAGYERQFNDSLRYWRTRFIMIPSPDVPQPVLEPSGEKLNDEETRLLGSDKLAQIFSSLIWIPQSERDKQVTYPPVRFIPTYLGPTACVLDEHLVTQLEEVQAAGPFGKKMKSERVLAEMTLPALAKLMREDEELAIKDHRWRTKFYPDSFTGYEFVNWLVREFRDVSTREQGAEVGQKLLEDGLFEHCRRRHGFIDGVYFYTLRTEYTIARTPRTSLFWPRSTRNIINDDVKMVGHYPGGAVKNSRRNRKQLVLSNSIVADVDTVKKSDQAEIVVLHYDLIHNPSNVFHFELNWLGTSARCIEDVLRQCSTKIERFGLKMVEAYVTQISDIRERNPFQSCFPVRLAVAPPIIADLAQRVAILENMTTNADATASNAASGFVNSTNGFNPVLSGSAQYFFEYALLQRFGFILDIEANELYPDRVDVVYSYRRSEFTHSQFVHRTGVAFVQVLGGSEGFLFLTNRLMAPGRMSIGPGRGANNGKRGNQQGGLAAVAAVAERLRTDLAAFCNDKSKLDAFYDEQLALLPTSDRVPEEPPPLSI